MMPDKKFDLGDYVEVKDRIKLFYELYGQGRLETTYELTDAPDGKARVICRALAYRTPDDLHPATGTSWMELPGTTPYTRGSEIENAETSAIGRAIGFLGILIDRSIATSNEIDAKKGEPAREPNLRAEMEGVRDGGLIGIAEKGTARTTDFEIRQSPDGPFLGFRLMDGKSKSGQIIEVYGPMAEALPLLEPLGKRLQIWGTFAKRDLSKGGSYQAFVAEKIQTPDWSLPADLPDTIPLFSEQDEAELDAAAMA